MIDWNKSAELNGVSVDNLKARAVRFSQSNKTVVAICDICGKERNIVYALYRDLCHKCSHGTPDATEANRSRAILQFSDDNTRQNASDTKKLYYINNPCAKEEQSIQMIQYHKDHPEFAAAHSEWLTQYHKDHPEIGVANSERLIKYYKDNPEAGEKLSETLKNSVSHKSAVEKMVGGNDIVGHHMIYDHSDLSKNIMPMTRSRHQHLHILFRKHGIEIPHINVGNIKSL